MSALLRIADAIERVLRTICEWSGWLMVVLMVVICFDIMSRKLGYQIPGMGSTRLQELEWHLHTVLFSMWLGYCYILNVHPRVDTVTAHRTLRARAWIEVAGVLAFALPYAAMVAWFGLGFVATSYMIGEGSEAVIGLSHRWIIKGIFILGLWMLVAAIVAVFLRLIVYLFGDRATAARADLNIQHAADPM
jgi:TRAP-type mannitol/chloroaromatic compound transport system permease small subunit